MMGIREAAEFTNMCMVYDGKGRVLVQQRTDPGWPGITFPGGHVERGETFLHSAIREVKEETGLTVRNLELCGLKQFQKTDGTRYVVVLYKTNDFSGQMKSSEEGEVFWIPIEDIDRYECASSFKEMLPVFLDGRWSECFFDEAGGLILV